MRIEVLTKDEQVIQVSDKTWVTYRMEDGSQIFGEYAWVENPEFFEEVSEPTRVIKETWILKESEIVTFNPIYWQDDDYDEWEEWQDEFEETDWDIQPRNKESD